MAVAAKNGINLESKSGVKVGSSQEQAIMEIITAEIGTEFYVEAIEPSKADKQHDELVARLDALTREIAALRARPAENS